MYVIRERKTKTVLDIVQSPPGRVRKPEDVYPGFDPETMELGESKEAAIPAWFTIEKGIVKAIDPPEEPAEAKPTLPPLEELKASAIAHYSELAFTLRRALIPDHEQQNAALGVYDEQRTASIRETVKAFRDEFHRLEAAIEKVKSVRGFKDVTPNFPTQVAGAPPAPGAAPEATAEPVRPVERPVRIATERPRRPNS